MARERTSYNNANMPTETDVNVAKELRELRVTRLEWSMDKMARQLGYAGASSYQRYENELEMSGKALPTHLIFKLLKTVVNRGEPRIQRDEIVKLAKDPSFGIPPMPPDPEPLSEDEERLRKANIRIYGGIASGVWRETEVMGRLDKTTFIPRVSDPEIAEIDQFAVLIQDDSANEVFQKGEWAICVQAADLNRGYRNGDLVLVQRTKNDLHELTIQRVRRLANPDATSFELNLPTSNILFREWPTLVGRPDDWPPTPPGERPSECDPELAIVGFVIAKFARL